MQTAVNQDIVSRLKALPTASISDGLDVLGRSGALLGIAALENGFRAVGPAFTVRYAPIAAGGVALDDFLDDVPPGAVVVSDNDARTDVTVWGGIMSQVAVARGIAGTVINGACRDVATSLAEEYPLFSRGRYMRTCKDRVHVVAVGETVTIAGVEIEPGAVVCADSDGVVVVTAADAERVADIAEGIERAESGIVAAVRAGSTLRQARADFAYYQLQRRQP
jgi:4-hydroxy-4-methyl-2-oxoglutarate aldolase